MTREEIIQRQAEELGEAIKEVICLYVDQYQPIAADATAYIALSVMIEILKKAIGPERVKDVEGSFIIISREEKKEVIPEWTTWNKTDKNN